MHFTGTKSWPKLDESQSAGHMVIIIPDNIFYSAEGDNSSVPQISF